MNAQSDFGGCSARLLDRSPERLVVTGARCCLAGYQYADIDCWETAWTEYVRMLGTDDARRLVGELQCMVRVLRRDSERPLSFFPYGCCHICRDEGLLLSLVSALQDGDEATATFAARHLTARTAAAAIGDVMEATRSFARALKNTGQKLLSVPAAVVASIVSAGSEPAAKSTMH
jgi:predicted Zn-ribbon and HTH transcriptional regulator